MTKYNKWDLIDKVLGSTLGEDNKLLLIELVRRCNYEEHKNWDCWPSVQRLAQVRGMKNERHFKGVDVYLPGLVDKRKHGRKNTYTINPAAIMELSQFETVIKHTPALEANTPAPAVNTPAPEANTPAVEGANSTENNTVDSTSDSTSSPQGGGPVSKLPVLSDLNIKDKVDEVFADHSPIVLNSSEDSPIGSTDVAVPIEGTDKDTPATEGVLEESQVETVEELPEDAYYMWNGRKILRAGYREPFSAATTAAPVEPEVKCSECNKGKVFSNGLCWDCA